MKENELHPGLVNILRYFKYNHLPIDLQVISRKCHDLAHEMTIMCNHNPELTAGLRKLLEAKDCFVRARIDQVENEKTIENDNHRT